MLRLRSCPCHCYGAWGAERDARPVRLRELAFADGIDFLFSVLPRGRGPVLRDSGRDFFPGDRATPPRLETPVTRLMPLRTGRLPTATFPAIAPTTPPTTAPKGPATLPIAAPVTAPAVCFEIGGTWMSSDDRRLFFFSRFRRSGINAAPHILHFEHIRIALTTEN